MVHSRLTQPLIIVAVLCTVGLVCCALVLTLLSSILHCFACQWRHLQPIGHLTDPLLVVGESSLQQLTAQPFGTSLDRFVQRST
jgi:hypothetical protein